MAESTTLDTGGRFRRSWRLLTTSWRLVRHDPGLRNLVLVSGAISCGVGLAFFSLFATLIALDRGLLLFAVSVVALYPFTFLTVFLGVALVAAGHEAMEGRQPSLAFGFGVARARLQDIAGWALLATGVGILLDQVIRHIPGAGRLAQFALGAAWAMVTLFAVPVIALEGCGARQCVRRSASIFRSRWGEGLIGSLSIGAALMVVTIPACAVMGVGLTQMTVDPSPWALAMTALGATTLSVAAYGGVVMRDLYSLALYRYATEGAVVGGFHEGDLVGGLKLKPRGLNVRSRLLRRGRERAEVLPAERRARRLCWIALGVEAAGIAAATSEGSMRDAGGVGFLAGCLLLLGAAAWGVWRLRRARPWPLAMWLVLAGALGAPASVVWAVIPGPDGAYGVPLLLGMLLAFATLSLSVFRPRTARRGLVPPA